MEDINEVSSTHEDESATPSSIPDPLRRAQFVAPNARYPSESETLNMENPDYHSNTPTPRGGRFAQVVVSVEPADETTSSFPKPNPRHAQFHNYTGILYLIYAATLLYMFPSLIAPVELKFQNKAHSAFETHRFFANMAVVAYIIAITLSVALFCLKARLESSINTETFSPIYYRILQSVLYFSSLLAPLSFVLVLFFPRGFDLIGYSLVFTLFLVIVACSFSNYIKLLCKRNASNFVALQRNETSSHSTLTITHE